MEEATRSLINRLIKKKDRDSHKEKRSGELCVFKKPTMTAQAEWECFLLHLKETQKKWEDRHSLAGINLSYSTTQTKDVSSVVFGFVKETKGYTTGSWIFDVYVSFSPETTITYSMFLSVTEKSFSSISELEREISRLFEGNWLIREIKLWW